MNRTLTAIVAIVGLSALGLQDGAKEAVEKPLKKQVADYAKKKVEIPVERKIDVAKMAVELPVKRAIVPETAAAPAMAGRVEWRESFAAAVEAAKSSGRPVLLFQLLGRLDEEFC